MVAGSVASILHLVDTRGEMVMLVKRQKRQDILRAIERYDRATREHAFRGSRDPESMEEIDAG